MVITLNCLSDIFTKPNKQGIQKLVKRNVQYKKQFDTNFMLVEQHLNSKGIPSKKWSIVKQGEEYFRVNHRFEELEKLTKPIEFKGF